MLTRAAYIPHQALMVYEALTYGPLTGTSRERGSH